MAKSSARIPDNLGLPLPRLCLAITGHRENNPAFAANRDAVSSSLVMLFEAADAITKRQADGAAPTRLFSLLAHGADLMAVDEAMMHGWEIAAPLPFGLDLNVAINADPASVEDFDALIKGLPTRDAETANRASHIRKVAACAKLFELAEADAAIEAAHRLMLAAGPDLLSTRRFSDIASGRVAAAGRIMIRRAHCDLGWYCTRRNRRHAAYHCLCRRRGNAGNLDRCQPTRQGLPFAHTRGSFRVAECRTARKQGSDGAFYRLDV
jgi:hypothetical protein